MNTYQYARREGSEKWNYCNLPWPGLGQQTTATLATPDLCAVAVVQIGLTGANQSNSHRQSFSGATISFARDLLLRLPARVAVRRLFARLFSWKPRRRPEEVAPAQPVPEAVHGLSFTEATELLDLMEQRGIDGAKIGIEPDGRFSVHFDVT